MFIKKIIHNDFMNFLNFYSNKRTYAQTVDNLLITCDLSIYSMSNMCVICE